MVAPALLAALLLLLILLVVRPAGWVLILFLFALFLPGRWWHWKTRRFRRGLKRLKRGDAAEARSEFEAFLFQVAREPNFRRVQPYFNLGRSYPYVAAAQANLGVCDLHLGRPEDALERFRASLSEEESWVPARYGEAVALKALGRMPEAESAARAALDLRPSYLAARLMLGSLLRQDGRESEAAAILAPVVEKGGDPDALIHALDHQWGIGEM